MMAVDKRQPKVTSLRARVEKLMRPEEGLFRRDGEPNEELINDVFALAQVGSHDCSAPRWMGLHVGERLGAFHPPEGELRDVVLVDCDFYGLQAAGVTFVNVVAVGRHKWATVESERLKRVVVKHCPPRLWSQKAEVHRADFLHKPGEFRTHSRSCGVGLCLDGATAEGLVFAATDLRAMSGRGLVVRGECAFQDCDLDGVDLVGYRVSQNGSLCVIGRTDGSQYEVQDATFATADEPRGRLELSDVVFRNCCFSLPNGGARFQPTSLQGVVFEDCDFRNCLVAPKSEEELRWRFVEGSLDGMELRDVQGRLELSATVGGLSLRECTLTDPELKLTSCENHPTRLNVTDTTFVSPHVEGGPVLTGEWNNVVISVPAGREGSFAGCTFRDMDLRTTSLQVDGKMDLTGVRFEKCNLEGFDFRNCVLDSVTFVDCDLQACSFKELHGVPSDISMTGADTRLAKLDLSGAELRNLTLAEIDSDQVSAMLCAGTTFRGGAIQDIAFARWHAPAVVFRGTSIVRCTFSDCEIDGAKFDEEKGKPCRLSEVDFSGQKVLEDVGFLDVFADQTVDLRECILRRVELGCASFFSHGVNLSATVWENCDWTGKGRDLREFPFGQVKCLRGCTLEEADLTGVTVVCDIESVKLNACTIGDAQFGAKSTPVHLSDLQVAANETGELCFVGCTITGASFKPVHEGTKGSWGEVCFEECPSVQGLKIEQLRMSGLKIDRCPEVIDLRILDVDVANGKWAISSSAFAGVQMKSLEAPGGCMKDAEFRNRARFQDCHFQGGSVQGRCTNLLNLAPDSLWKTDFNDTKFTELPDMTGDLSAMHRQEVSFCGASFDNCRFTNSSLDGVDFTKCTFGPGCDLTGVRGARLENTKFDGAQLLARIDRLTFKSCNFCRTRFSTPGTKPPREICGARFEKCDFDDDTDFAGVRVVGGDLLPEVFGFSDSLKCLVLRDVVLEKQTLKGFRPILAQKFRLRNSRLRDCEFRGPSENPPSASTASSTYEVHAENSELRNVMFCNVDFYEKRLTLDTCICEGLTLERCGLGDIHFRNSHLTGLTLKVSSDHTVRVLNLNQCSFGTLTFEKLPPLRPPSASSSHPVAQHTIILDKVRFDECFFLEPDPFRFAGREFATHEIHSFSVTAYYCREQFQGKTYETFNQLDVSHARRGHSLDEWPGTPLWCSKVQSICEFIEQGEVHALRHPGRDFQNRAARALMQDGLRTFKRKLPGDLFSQKTTDSLDQRAVKLLDTLKDVAEADRLPQQDVAEHLKTLAEWESLMVLRTLLSDAEKRKRHRSDLAAWVAGALSVDGVNCQLVKWDTKEGRKLYSDFGFLSRILALLAKNIDMYAQEKVALVSGESRDADDAFVLHIRDNGPGFGRYGQKPREFLEESRLGTELRTFAADYCQRVVFHTVSKSASGEEETRVFVAGKGGVTEPEASVQKDLGLDYGGTGYAFWLELPRGNGDSLQDEERA
jgi:uncharacterized protein YjbI with pentapeptide repeats